MKPGRNQLCSCGSGKKFKRCCAALTDVRSGRLAAPPQDAPRAANLRQLTALAPVGRAAARTANSRQLTDLAPAGQAASPQPATRAPNLQQLIDLARAGRYTELEHLAKVQLGQTPNAGDVWQLLALALWSQGKDALHALDATARLLPQDAEAHGNLGTALRSRGRLAEAIDCYRRALELKPEFAEAHSNLGGALRDLGRFDEALASYRHALALQPDLAVAHYNLGDVYLALGRLENAIESYDRSIALNPAGVDAHFFKSHCLLLQGNFAEGWPLYEWRLRGLRSMAVRSVPPYRPRWHGQAPLAGKTLLLSWEQGLGDTLQFSRFARAAEARGAHVMLEVPPSLRRLMKSLSPTIDIVDDLQGVASAADYQSPLLSLPGAFATTIDSIPATLPYLFAEPERVDSWRRRLGSGGFKIGIAWQGGRGKIDLGRSFPVHLFQPLAALANVRLISLQKSHGSEQLLNLPQGMQVEQLPDDFDSGTDAFIDTAAVMQSLDLVITADTAIAHLAGALGRPTWVALQAVPEWRWLEHRSDSPWYPTLRLFRQTHAGDWTSVFDHMHAALQPQLRPA